MRPAAGERDPADHVGVGRVALDVQPARHFRHDGEDFERNVALAQPRQIDVAARAAREQVAPPQQRVGVKVCDEQPPVQFARAVLGRLGLASGETLEAYEAVFDRGDARAFGALAAAAG
jgi:hypothetical protein